MNHENGNLVEQIKSMSSTKQGIFIIIISMLLFFSMYILNDNRPWDYPLSQYSGVVGFGLSMSKWAVISFIGIAIGLIRIFVINGKNSE